jgi:histidine ammonia-lyase
MVKTGRDRRAMSLEALFANMKPYDVRLHQLRVFRERSVSKSITKCIEGSDLVTGKLKTKVQDAYSMRSSPQVIGLPLTLSLMHAASGNRVEWRW